MRILRIHPLLKTERITPAIGGMARVTVTLTRLLMESGHEVCVLPIPERIGSRLVWGIAPGRTINVPPVMELPGLSDLAWLPWAGMRLRPLPHGPRALAYDAMALVGLYRAIREFQPDIIHNHLARAPFPRLAKALRMRPPMLLTHHHGSMGESLHAYDEIVFPSDESRKEIARQSKYPEAKTRCIYNAVNSAFLHGGIPGASERHGVYYVGSIRARKGIDLILEAYRSDPRLHSEPLHVCGSGVDDPLVERAARVENLPVIQEGRLTAEEVAARLRTARLVVIPSRMETLCTALVEAICVGTPVVGWSPTVRELERGSGMQIGLPFDGRTQTAAELAKNILEAKAGVYCRTDQREKMAAWARSTFNESRFVEEYLQAYRELLDSK
jgi:glycosyltransferase involved in cell wall biosynthesis